MSQSGQSGESRSFAPAEKLEMKKKLDALGMWEAGMSVEHMKVTLDVVKQSETEAMANRSVPDITENGSPETPSSAQILYSQTLISSNSRASSERKSSSPEMIQHKKSSSQGKSSEFFSPNNKNSPKKGAKSVQETNINKARSANWDNSSEGTNDNKQKNHRQNPQSRHEEKIPKFKINPLNFLANQNDVPLVPHYRKFHNQDEGGGSGASTTEKVDKAVAQLTNHLRRIAEIWHNQQRSSVDTGFEWGSAIKVGDANGSLDEKSNTDEETRTINEADQSIKTLVNVLNEPTRRRRACTTNRSIIYDYGSENDNSEDDFQICPKRKKTAPKKLSTSRSTRVKSIEPVEKNETTENSSSFEKSSKVRTMCIDVSDDVVDTDDDTRGEPPKKNERSKSEETAGSVYPRRIIPPKPKWIGLRSKRPLHAVQSSSSLFETKRRKEDDNENVETSRNIERSKSNLGLRDAEIAEDLEKDDSDVIDDDNDVPGVLGNDTILSEIRPLRYSNRMKLSIKRLTQTREKEKTEEELEKDDSDVIDDDNNVTRVPGNDTILSKIPPSSYSDRTKLSIKRLEQTREKKKTEEELEKDDSDVIDDDDVTGVPGNDTILSGIPPLSYSDRMKLSIKRLTQTREKEKREEEIHLEHERIKEETLLRKKQERVAKRVREEAEKVKREEMARIEELKREEQWRAFMEQKNKVRPVARTELFPDGLPQNIEATVIEENHFGTENQNEAEIISDDEIGGESAIERVLCPICSKPFKTNEIEAHAAECEAFETVSSPGTSRSSTPTVSVTTINSSKRNDTTKYECQICSNFTTMNGKKFEDHMTRCLERQHRGDSSSHDTIVAVPTSPIRTLRPISEQTDSEIDYKGQFKPKQKSNKNIGRKRKR